MGSQEAALSQIRALYEGGSVAAMTDAELVERFAKGSGERAALAFSALVERHGPMVMRVCRASLRNEHDADDAFQAVFLVLIHKAGTLWVRDSLGPWLHGVASRTSASAKAQAERRRTHEQRRARASREAVEMTQDDLAATVHEEVGRLPGHFRDAVILCDLEGLSHEVAARELGWPIGTVKSRQARGRERLRSRLARRGLAPTDAAIVIAMTPLPVTASIVRTTVCAALTFKAGQAATAGLVSAASITLAREFLRSITMKQIGLSVFSILTVGAIVSGTVILTGGMTAADGPPGAPRRGGPPAVVVPTAPRPPAGSVFALRFAADERHDAGAGDRDGDWVKVDPRIQASLDGLITRVNNKVTTILVKHDPQNLTERDLLEVKRIIRDERGSPAIFFRLTQDAAVRFGALTRAHLPEDNGAFKSRLAIIVEGVVVAMPFVNAEIGDAGVIEFEGYTRPEEIDRMVRRLEAAAAYNAPPPKAKAVSDQAEAIREARAVDLPALAEANRVMIESEATGYRMVLRDPRSVEPIRRALRPGAVPPSGGVLAATLLFFHDDELIRKVWVFEGGEWGFERPGTSWTTGADAELWSLVKSRLSK